MKLRTRLTLASAAVTTISTLLIGGFSINATHNSGIALLDNSLNQVVISVQGNSNAALSQALYSVQQSDVALTLVYYLSGKAPTLLNTSRLSVIPEPTSQEIKVSLKRPLTHVGVENYRMRTIRISDHEYVVVAGSLHEIDARYKSDLVRLLIFIFLCLAVSACATWILVRRDMTKIEALIGSAKEISNGQMDVDIPSVKGGDSEVDQLAESLSRMVIALRRTAEIEEQSTKRMQDFLGDASHELRTPLTVVKGYVELLAGTAMVDPLQRRRAFERVGSEIVRMESLISDLLFLAEFGEVPTKEMSKVNLSQILQSHLGDFFALNSSRQITIDIENSVFMRGSEEHLARLFSNIFGNISRHTSPDVPVRARLRQMESGIDLVIEDGGPGLPESAYLNTLQSFQRFDMSRSRENGGSGLGMSIIFAIVREHEGTVTLERSELGGLSVHVFFGNLSA